MKKASLIVALVLSTWSFASISHATGYIYYVGIITTNEDRNSDTSNKINAVSGETINFTIVAQDAQGNDGVISSDSTLSLIGNIAGQELKLYWNFSGSWTESQNIMHFTVTVPSVYSETSKCSDVVVKLSANVLTAHDQYTDVIKERTIRVCTTTPTSTRTPTSSTLTSTKTFTPLPSSSTPSFIASVKPTTTPSPTAIFSPEYSPIINTISQSPYQSSSSSTIIHDIFRGIGKTTSASSTAVAVIATMAGAISVLNIVPSIVSASTNVISSFGYFFSSMNARRNGIFSKKKGRSEHWVKVVDSITGKGVGGSMIQVRTPDGKVRTIWRTDDKTGDTGDLLPPGEYEFAVTKGGWRFPSSMQPIFAKQKGDIIYRRGIIEVGQDGKVTVKGDKNEQ